MAKLSLDFHLIYLLSSFLILGAYGVSIQAYNQWDFTRLVWESNSTLGCSNLPREKQTYVYSIRTDTCFIAYLHAGCKSYWSEKYLPGDISLNFFQLGRHRVIGSFQICNEEEGGNQLNVDITKHFLWGSSGSPAVLESYKNVCSCVNVPQHVQNMSKWSIDNHHNDLLAYYEPDCSENKWNSTFIKAGHNWYSRDMNDHQKRDIVTQKTYRIQSFGPDPYSTYYKITCNSSPFTTTKTPKLFESLTERTIGKDAGNKKIQACQCQDLSNQIEQLKFSSFLISGAHGVSIQAFAHSDFTGPIWGSNSTSGCNNLPQNKHQYVFSIRTNACFIAYNDLGCKSSFSEKYLPGSLSLTFNHLGRLRLIRSFQICNEVEGGNQLNVDITRYYKAGSDVSPDVLQSYENVCACVNIPQYVQNISKWSTDNHHNDILAYYESDCAEIKWKSTFIKAGHNWGSRDMHDHQNTDSLTQKKYKIKSFGPNPNSSYFQIRCKSSHVITTETPKRFASTTEKIMSTNSGNSNIQAYQYQDLSNQIDQLKRNQEKFQSEILQQFWNFTTQLKDDLHELFA